MGKDKPEQPPPKKGGGIRRLLFGGRKTSKDAADPANKTSSTDQLRQLELQVENSSNAPIPPIVQGREGSIASNNSSSKKPKAMLGLFSSPFSKNRQSTSAISADSPKGRKSKEKSKKAASKTTAKKKGRRPTMKEMAYVPKPRKEGTVQRVKNQYYPGAVDFRYTTPKEVWMPNLGNTVKTKTKSPPAVVVDFGDSARIIRDASDMM